MGPDGQLVHSDAFPPETLVDTLGAGDTFNAAVIFALAEGGHKRGAATVWPRFSLARPHLIPVAIPREEPAGRPHIRLPDRGQEMWDPGLRGHCLSLCLETSAPHRHTTSPLHPATSNKTPCALLLPPASPGCAPLALAGVPLPLGCTDHSQGHQQCLYFSIPCIPRGPHMTPAPLGPSSLAMGHPPVHPVPQAGQGAARALRPVPPLPTPPPAPSRLGLPAPQGLQPQGLPLPLWHQYWGLWPPRPQH